MLMRSSFSAVTWVSFLSNVNANVNPNVDHPRWSQASERFIGPGGLFSSRRKATLMFNGYGEEVSHLYKNLNLKDNF